LAIRSASMGFAGTDFSQHRHFAMAAERYRRYFIDVINDDIIRRAGNKGVYLRGQDLWSQVRDFEYRLPDAGWVVRERVVGLSVLVGWVVASVGLLLLATRRLRVE
jgi:ABC-2 type transport system permease protein